MLANATAFRGVIGALTLVVLSSCAHQPPSAASANSPPASSGAQHTPTAANSSPQARAQAFVTDVLASGAGLEQRYPLVMLGPALYAAVKAQDPSIEQLGTGVSLMNADNPNALQEARVCVETACAKFLRAKGMRDLLQPFGAAQYRSATSEEREVMLQRSPESIPKDEPASVAVAGAQLLGIYALAESMVWIELISKPSQVSISPDAAAPSTPEQRALDASKCFKFDSIVLESPEDVFAANTTPQELTDGVVYVVGLLDTLLLEKKSQATGAWAVQVTFGPKGISKVSAAPKPGVDPSVVVRLNEKALRHAPISRNAQLSLGLELTLHPCSK